MNLFQLGLLNIIKPWENKGTNYNTQLSAQSNACILVTSFKELENFWIGLEGKNLGVFENLSSYNLICFGGERNVSVIFTCVISMIIHFRR